MLVTPAPACASIQPGRALLCSRLVPNSSAARADDLRESAETSAINCLGFASALGLPPVFFAASSLSVAMTASAWTATHARVPLSRLAMFTMMVRC